MLGLIARFLFTATAVAPVGYVYAWALLLENRGKEAGILVVICGLLILTAAYFLYWSSNNLEVKNLDLQSVEIADQENVAFLLLYISPLFRANPSDLNYAIAIPVVILFTIVIMFGNNYHFNPLLNVFGWHFYKVKTPDGVARVLITRKTIRNILGKRKVVELSDYVVLEKSK